MKRHLIILALIMLTGCASTETHLDRRHAPETMLITYHVKPGKEAELQGILTEAWAAYRKERMVFAKPHIVIQDKEEGDKTRVIEIFRWVSASVPDHAPDSVKRLWDQMMACCETRGGHNGLELDPVDLVLPDK